MKTISYISELPKVNDPDLLLDWKTLGLIEEMTKDKFDELQWLAAKAVSNIEEMLHQIDHSFNNNEIDECQRAVLTLKGGMAVFGAKKLSDSLFEIEVNIKSNGPKGEVNKSISHAYELADKTVKIIKKRYMV